MLASEKIIPKINKKRKREMNKIREINVDTRVTGRIRNTQRKREIESESESERVSERGRKKDRETEGGE